MPNMCGKEAIAIISNKYLSVKVIALSAYIHEKHIIDMLKCGAKGYLSKAMNSKNDVVDSVEQVLKGGYYFPEQMLNEWNIPAKYFISQIISKKYRTTLLNDRENEFVSYCASDDSYQQIVEKMGVA